MQQLWVRFRREANKADDTFNKVERQKQTNIVQRSYSIVTDYGTNGEISKFYSKISRGMGSDLG